MGCFMMHEKYLQGNDNFYFLSKSRTIFCSHSNNCDMNASLILLKIF